MIILESIMKSHIISIFCSNKAYLLLENITIFNFTCFYLYYFLQLVPI